MIRLFASSFARCFPTVSRAHSISLPCQRVGLCTFCTLPFVVRKKAPAYLFVQAWASHRVLPLLVPGFRLLFVSCGMICTVNAARAIFFYCSRNARRTRGTPAVLFFLFRRSKRLGFFCHFLSRSASSIRIVQVRLLFSIGCFALYLQITNSLIQVGVLPFQEANTILLSRSISRTLTFHVSHS